VISASDVGGMGDSTFNAGERWLVVSIPTGSLVGTVFADSAAALSHVEAKADGTGSGRASRPRPRPWRPGRRWHT